MVMVKLADYLILNMHLPLALTYPIRKKEKITLYASLTYRSFIFREHRGRFLNYKTINVGTAGRDGRA